MPTGRHPTHRTPLERKLELLEARFSQDPVSGGGSVNSSAPGNSQHSFSFDGSFSNPAAAANSSRLSNSAGLDRVQKATERHLHRVQQKVVVWASDSSNASANTNVMGNHHQDKDRVVPNTPESQATATPEQEDEEASKTATAISQQTNKPVREEKQRLQHDLSTSSGLANQC